MLSAHFTNPSGCEKPEGILGHKVDDINTLVQLYRKAPFRRLKGLE